MTNPVRRILLPINVYIKQNWADPWVLRPNVEPIAAVIKAGAVGQMTFRVRYGVIKWPDSDPPTIETVDYTDIQREWIKVEDGNDVLLWQGRIESDTRSLHGNENAIPSGEQIFTAYDGTRILEKILVGTSAVNRGTADNPKSDFLRRVNGVNIKRDGVTGFGNRSKNKVTDFGIDHYVFGSEDLENDSENWQLADYLEYLFAEHVQVNNTTDQPIWTYSGDLSALQIDAQPKNFGETSTLSLIEHLRYCINVKYGMNFVVLPTPAGFNLKVFSMSWQDVVYKTYTLPKNPRQLDINPTTDGDTLQTVVEKSQVESYGKIVLYGAPAITCVTAWYDSSSDSVEPDPSNPTNNLNMLRPGWSFGQEEAYIRGHGASNSTAAQNDTVRRSHKFRNVFQNYELRSIWPSNYVPKFDEETGDAVFDKDEDTELDRQNQKCLAWIPIKPGFDFGTNPPQYIDQSGQLTPQQKDFFNPRWKNVEWMAPMAIFERMQQTEDDETGDLIWQPTGVYVEGSQAGFDLYVEESTVAFTFESDEINHFGGAADRQTIQDSEFLDFPYFDLSGQKRFTKVETELAFRAVTVAFEYSERMRQVYKTSPTVLPADGVLYKYENEAEFIYVAPGTIYSVQGSLEQSFFNTPEIEGIIIRDDSPFLHRVMAGLIMRYVNARFLAKIHSKGVWDWSNNIGDILQTLGDGTDATDILAPITSIQWAFEKDFETKLSTGFAVNSKFE